MAAQRDSEVNRPLLSFVSESSHSVNVVDQRSQTNFSGQSQDGNGHGHSHGNNSAHGHSHGQDRDHDDHAHERILEHSMSGNQDNYDGHNAGYGHNNQRYSNGHEHGQDHAHDHGHNHGHNHKHGHGQGHGHSHGDGHSHDEISEASSLSVCCCSNNSTLSRLTCALFICILFAVSELIGGYLAGSLAIMTDAAHLFSDVASFGVSIFAICMSRRAPTYKFTFGMRRAETVGALLSVLIIWLITGVLIYEGVLRVKRIVSDPQTKQIEGRLMFFVACGGVLVNVALMCVLSASGQSHSHSHGGGSSQHGHSHSLSERAAYIHAIGDLVQSLGVVLAGGMIWWKSDGQEGNGWWQLADPICTFLFGILVLYTTKQIFTDVVNIFLMRAPVEADMESLLDSIIALPYVHSVHDFHAFSVSPDFPLVIGHVVVNDQEGGDYSTMLKGIKACCLSRGIDHVTIQLEPVDGLEKLDCSCPSHSI